MSSSTSSDSSTTPAVETTEDHLRAALEESDNGGVKFHVRQALQFIADEE